MDLTDELKQALSDRVTEVVALTVSCVMENDYR